MHKGNLCSRLLDDRCQTLQTLPTVCGEDARAMGELQRLSLEIAEQTASLFQNQGGGGKVPGRKQVFEVHLAASHSKVAKLGSSCSESAYVVAPEERLADNVGTNVGIFLVIDRQCRTHDAI